MTSMYLKVTEDCNMRCPFCYVPKQPLYMTKEIANSTIKKYDPDYIIFHGGEPLLNTDVINYVIDTYPDKEYSLSTNLTLPLNEDRLAIINRLGGKNIATSYSVDRFNNTTYSMFKENVKLLEEYTLLVTLTEEQLKVPPKEFVNEILSLNPAYVDLERLYDTKKDKLFYKLTDEYLTEVFKYLPKEKNVLRDNMLRAIEYIIPVYNPCCSKTLVTVNADGSIIHCPNLVAKQQDDNKHINKDCLLCDIYEYCEGDCESFKSNTCKFPIHTFNLVRKGIL